MEKFSFSNVLVLLQYPKYKKITLSPTQLIHLPFLSILTKFQNCFFIITNVIKVFLHDDKNLKRTVPWPWM